MAIFEGKRRRVGEDEKKTLATDETRIKHGFEPMVAKVVMIAADQRLKGAIDGPVILCLAAIASRIPHGQGILAT
jgi:hypothetical protein